MPARCCAPCVRNRLRVRCNAHINPQQVHERYHALARAVLQYEKATFAAWRASADGAAMAALKQPILARDPGSGGVTVNFSPGLKALALEARYLDRMRFEIPPVAMQVRLSRGRSWAYTPCLAARCHAV